MLSYLINSPVLYPWLGILIILVAVLIPDEVTEVNADFGNMFEPAMTEEEEKKMKKFASLKEILDEFMDKRKDLIEFEKELKKHKDELTPGTVGES